MVSQALSPPLSLFLFLISFFFSLPTPLSDSHGSVFCVDSILGPVFPTWWERWFLPPPASAGAAYDSGTRGGLSPGTHGSVLGAVETGAASSCGDHIDCGPGGWRADQVWALRWDGGCGGHGDSSTQTTGSIARQGEGDACQVPKQEELSFMIHRLTSQVWCRRIWKAPEPV